MRFALQTCIFVTLVVIGQSQSTDTVQPSSISETCGVEILYDYYGGKSCPRGNSCLFKSPCFAIKVCIPRSGFPSQHPFDLQMKTIDYIGSKYWDGFTSHVIRLTGRAIQYGEMVQKIVADDVLSPHSEFIKQIGKKWLRNIEQVDDNEEVEFSVYVDSTERIFSTQSGLYYKTLLKVCM